jgi:hypothetical protein
MTDGPPSEPLSAPSSSRKVLPAPAVLHGWLRSEFIAPRPDLAGCRVRTSSCATIYVIDPEGFRRWVPNQRTYSRLFRDAGGVIDTFDVAQIAQRPKLTTGAMLVQGDVSPSVYLLDHGVKRLVPSPAAMDKYHFAWDRIFVVKQFLIDKIPNGRSWD